jgi:osmotically-inducible protein OsmY
MKINAEDGSVILAGTVRSVAEQLLAERIAQAVPGVKQVKNELKVASAPARK